MTETSYCNLLWLQSLQIGVVWMATRLLNHRLPQIAHVLWLVVLLKCVTPPLWSSSTGIFCWVQTASHTQFINTGAEIVPKPAAVQNLPEASEPPLEFTGASVATNSDISNASMDVVVMPDTTTPGYSWTTLLLTLWVAGIVVASCVVSGQLIRCFILCRDSRAAVELQLAVDRLSQQVGLRRRARVLVTCSNVGPAVIGVLRPLIILPHAIVSSVSTESLDRILTHELIHIRRGDLWLGLLQTLARLIWWFHPLVHWTVRQSSRAAESCCDQESLAELNCSPREYAQCLLEILEQKKLLTPIPSFPGVRAMDITSNRLERIMKTRQGSLRTGRIWSRTVLLLSALLLLPGAAFVANGDDGGGSNEGIIEQTNHEATPIVWRGMAVARKPTHDTSQIVEVYDVQDVLLAFAVATHLDLGTEQGGVKDSQGRRRICQ